MPSAVRIAMTSAGFLALAQRPRLHPRRKPPAARRMAELPLAAARPHRGATLAPAQSAPLAAVAPRPGCQHPRRPPRPILLGAPLAAHLGRRRRLGTLRTRAHHLQAGQWAHGRLTALLRARGLVSVVASQGRLGLASMTSGRVLLPCQVKLTSGRTCRCRPGWRDLRAGEWRDPAVVRSSWISSPHRRRRSLRRHQPQHPPAEATTSATAHSRRYDREVGSLSLQPERRWVWGT